MKNGKGTDPWWVAGGVIAVSLAGAGVVMRGRVNKPENFPVGAPPERRPPTVNRPPALDPRNVTAAEGLASCR